LVASLRPPLQRTLMIAKLDAAAVHQGRRYDLAMNEFADGTLAPLGYVHLDSFRLDSAIPVWTWRIGDALIEQRVWMSHGENTTYAQYAVVRAREPVHLELTPLCTYRDYHAQNRGYRETLVTPIADGVKVDAFFGARPYRIIGERASCTPASQWWWNFRHRAESQRGLDDLEDLFQPARFCMTLAAGESGAVIMTAEDGVLQSSAVSLAREQHRQQELIDRAPIGVRRSACRQLVLAADQFIVARESGKSVIAGYPWFGDWGRDTMIALPGLTLATGRPEVAANLLRTFSRFVSEGMLPNRFPDAGEPPEYNTADATLWYFIAVDDYVRRTSDRSLLDELYPVLRSIVRWHQRGARHGIRVDARDGLLHAGEDGVQLTWMDAKIGDWVVTPRIGKPVEINALWCNALAIMRDFALTLDDAEAAREYGSAAERAARSFNERFWYEAGGYLYDVIDGPSGADTSLRPNQLFAVSLRRQLLDNGRARSVVDVCARVLWTPVGLRSLAPSDAAYVAHYVGGPRERDAVYHQGTTWSWLLGPFALAHYRVYNDAAAALACLDGVVAHLRDACIGQVSEIFDGAPPFAPRGCFAQAWGAAEILRVWSEINDDQSVEQNRTEAHRPAFTHGK
ncbi:MAG TPA: amylo-alpha-1,6-glucosidase, partial [Steroidobacter sp.]|nr:amylo-alpha-1,6-glucosidase [Steroidobacter sp.]